MICLQKQNELYTQKYVCILYWDNFGFCNTVDEICNGNGNGNDNGNIFWSILWTILSFCWNWTNCTVLKEEISFKQFPFWIFVVVALSGTTKLPFILDKFIWLNELESIFILVLLNWKGNFSSFKILLNDS